MGTDKRARQKAARAARMEEDRKADDRSRRIKTVSRLAVFGVVIIGAIALLAWWSGRGDDGGQAAETPPTLAPNPDDGATESTADGEGTEDGADDAAATPTPTEVVYTTFTDEDYGATPCPPDDGVDSPVLEFDDSFDRCIEPATPLTAVFDTSEGEIRVELDAENTTGTANNFVSLARSGYYDGIEIFRTDPSIGIVQSGAPHTNSAADPGPGYNIVDEGAGFSYEPGQLVMARTGEPNSSSAQFFFTVTSDASLLDSQGTYVVFGEVAEGLEVLETILGLHVEDPANPLGGGPSPTVRIDSVTIEG